MHGLGLESSAFIACSHPTHIVVRHDRIRLRSCLLALATSLPHLLCFDFGIGVWQQNVLIVRGGGVLRGVFLDSAETGHAHTRHQFIALKPTAWPFTTHSRPVRSLLHSLAQDALDRGHGLAGL